jgi:apolipoprotein N-acyltransferase
MEKKLLLNIYPSHFGFRRCWLRCLQSSCMSLYTPAAPSLPPSRIPKLLGSICANPKNLFSFMVFAVLSLFFGGLAVLAFAPFGHYLLVECALIFLLVAWNHAKSGKQAFWYGWLFGLAFFGFGIHWIYISIHDYGHASKVLSFSICAIFVVYLSLYPAMQGYILQRFYPLNNWRRLVIAFPASLVFLEWIRGWLLSGFPWLYFGYSHIDAPLGGWAKVFGVYGVTFFIAQTAGIILGLIYWHKNFKKIFAGVLYLFILWSAGFYLTKITWVYPVADPIQVSLIQNNIPLERKWQENEIIPILNSYIDVTKKNLTSKIIVWPEAAIPDYLDNMRVYLQRLSRTAHKHNTTILTGAIFYEIKNKKYYNGVLAFGATHGQYYKRNLVPFGEYMPLRFVLSWLDRYLNIPMSDFSSGPRKQNSLYIKNFLLAPFVCYEIAYANLVAEYLPQAKVLITVCENGWFGKSIATAQHLEIARMRSLEVGRYQLLSSSSIAAVIDDEGKIFAKTPMFTENVLTAEIKLLSGATPWVLFGQYVWLILILILLLIARQKR